MSQYSRPRRTYEGSIKELQEVAPAYDNANDFMKAHPYLYRWLQKRGVVIKHYFPRKITHKKYYNRENKGINAYKVKNNKIFKHYDFIIDACRDLNLTYYWINKVLDGKIPSIDGYYFKLCKDLPQKEDKSRKKKNS